MNLRYTNSHLAKMKQMREQGLSYRVIGLSFGASSTGVLRALERAAGIPRNTKPIELAKLIDGPRAQTPEAIAVRDKFKAYRQQLSPAKKGTAASQSQGAQQMVQLRNNIMNTKTKKSAFSIVEIMIAIVIVGLVLATLFPISYRIAKGAGSFGPTRSEEITVTRLYVDYSGGKKSQSSHYMVGTDKGVFEVDNGILLGLWNADELYAKLKEGQRYRVTTEGNKVVGFWLQSYPYITAVEPLTLVDGEGPDKS